MSKVYYIFIFGVVVLSSCDSSQEIAQLEADLDKLDVEIKSLEKNHPRKIDRNGDGEFDFFIESENGYVLEKYDRNFDGKIDEIYKYGSDDNLISVQVDEDLNGTFETNYFNSNFSLSVGLSDSDGNGVADVYQKFDKGVIQFSEKYYISDSVAKIGRMGYKFGHPVGLEDLTVTNLTEEEFESERRP